MIDVKGVFLAAGTLLIMAGACAPPPAPKPTSLDRHAESVMALNLADGTRWTGGAVLGCEIADPGAGRCRYRILAGSETHHLTRCYVEVQPNLWIKKACLELFPDDPLGSGVHKLI